MAKHHSVQPSGRWNVVHDFDGVHVFSARMYLASAEWTAEHDCVSRWICPIWFQFVVSNIPICYTKVSVELGVTCTWVTSRHADFKAHPYFPEATQKQIWELDRQIGRHKTSVLFKHAPSAGAVRARVRSSQINSPTVNRGTGSWSCAWLVCGGIFGIWWARRCEYNLLCRKRCLFDVSDTANSTLPLSKGATRRSEL